MNFKGPKISSVHFNFFFISFCRHLGVVGIDVSLASIESMLLSERWGHAYAFLVDREANAVIHPFSKPSAKVSADAFS